MNDMNANEQRVPDFTVKRPWD